MAVPRLDPRVSKDRIYEYGEYKVLSAQFRRRGQSTLWERLSGRHAVADKPRRAVRLWNYGALLALGVVVMLGAAGVAAFLESDTVRLSYTQQDLQTSLAGMDQSLNEAAGQNLASESRVLAEKSAVPQDVVYPAQTKYVVLTNIPDVAGRNLVENLYPLSRELIRIQP
jgi:hypothetical protein